MRRAGWRTGPPDQANAPIALQKPSCSNTAAFVKRLPGGRQGIVVVLLLSGAIAWGVWGSRRIERQANSVAADVSAATAHTPSPGKKVMQTNAESAPTTPITAAGNAIFRRLAVEDGNVVLSPASIAIALAMAAAGATSDSSTHTQMREALRHSLLGDETVVHEWFRKLIPDLKGADPKVELMVANSLWAAGDVKDAYAEVCKQVFLSDVYPLGSAAQINGWVTEKTQGKITRLLEQDPEGPAVLLNAVYFKGEWANKFDEKLTLQGTFQPFSGAAIPCQYMKKTEKRMGYGETDSAQMVLLPYGQDKRVGAYVALPKTQGKDGMVATVEEFFGSDTAWEAALTELGPRPVELELPRFRLEYGVKSITAELQALGVSDAFGPSAQFQRMTASQTYIRDVLHKAVIEVNEQGTVAAAATAVVMTRSLPPPPVRVKLDRPFLFVVYDRPAKTLLFAAKVETV